MTFRCQQCGECCSTMGEIIEILAEAGPFCFRIGYTTTCEERIVSVDPDKFKLFLKDSPLLKRSLACPFLREASPGRIICTVHNTRPDLCRQYSCFRVLVLDQEGNRIGKVPEGTRILQTMDHELREIWDREITATPVFEDDSWETFVESTLVQNRYLVTR